MWKSTHFEAFGNRAAQGQEGRSQLIVCNVDFIESFLQDKRAVQAREQHGH